MFIQSDPALGDEAELLYSRCLTSKLTIKSPLSRLQSAISVLFRRFRGRKLTQFSMQATSCGTCSYSSFVASGRQRFACTASLCCFGTCTMAGVTFIAIVTTSLAFYLLKRLLHGQNRNHAPLPPGPKGLPCVGNLTDLPPPGVPEYFHWLKHKDIYGPISCVTVLGQTLIIINDKHVAFELMDKRASIYSGRPKMKFAEM